MASPLFHTTTTSSGGGGIQPPGKNPPSLSTQKTESVAKKCFLCETTRANFWYVPNPQGVILCDACAPQTITNPSAVQPPPPTSTESPSLITLFQSINQLCSRSLQLRNQVVSESLKLRNQFGNFSAIQPPEPPPTPESPPVDSQNPSLDSLVQTINQLHNRSLQLRNQFVRESLAPPTPFGNFSAIQQPQPQDTSVNAEIQKLHELPPEVNPKSSPGKMKTRGRTHKVKVMPPTPEVTSESSSEEIRTQGETPRSPEEITKTMHDKIMEIARQYISPLHSGGNDSVWKCRKCGVTNTPQARAWLDGSKILCNAHGLSYQRKTRKAIQDILEREFDSRGEKKSLNEIKVLSGWLLNHRDSPEKLLELIQETFPTNSSS